MTHEKILRMTHLNPSFAETHAVFQLCGTTYPNKSYSINRPSSNTACIEYVVCGKGHVFIDGIEYTLQAGDTYYLPEGHDHYYYADRDDPWEKIWVNFSGGFAERLAELCGVGETFYYPALNTSDLLQKIQHYAAHADSAHAFEQCSAILAHLFIRMSNSLRQPTVTSASPVEKMMLYIEKHAAEALTLEQIANACGKSVSQAERLFRAEQGCSLYQYVLEQKLAIARQLLTETGMTVKDIAAYLSFNDEFYFSGLFRRKVGVSPTKYRVQAAAR